MHLFPPKPNLERLKMVAENKIKFKFNLYFRSLNLMRGVLVAEEDGIKDQYINKIFNAIWSDGLNLNDEEVLIKVLKNIDINPKTFLLRAQSQNIKDQLRVKTNEAFKKGIFGAPTFVVKDKIFWGQDRLQYAIAESVK